MLADRVFETTTDENGKYNFDNQYAKNMQNAFLVTILADGHDPPWRPTIGSGGSKWLTASTISVRDP